MIEGKRARLFFVLWLACVPGGSAADSRYRAKLRPPAPLTPILQFLPAGSDAFPEEKAAQEISERLAELGTLLRASPARGREAALGLLASAFKGGRLTSPEAALGGTASLQVVTSRDLPQALVLDGHAFGEELARLVAEFGTIDVAEFLVTSITVDGDSALTDVRYDLVGGARQGGRAERVGRWRMRWRRRSPGAAWTVSEWTALDDTRSHASVPVFTEVTEAALAGNASFRQQLRPGLDAWLATMDSVFMRDSMGHHGIAVGDVDGDGLDDIYVAQPAGLPNRLFRNKGDGTFEDITESAGLGVLDETSQALFADVDNDGDQDLVLVTGSGLLLFVNDGKGHFTRVPDAFRFKSLRGSPMSIAMADYDRDGFLDIYLCTYSYFIGASEDKAGPPTPYHDARNGPPDVLLRNDGHGHFVDVTEEVGLAASSDRFTFAAAWADYDEDGWPDLVVANDFGRKNLYHNEGLKDGKVTFKEVTAAAGVEDYGAGMSATWLDYDNDGHLDLYFGNMWSAAGQRVTAEPGFMPQAPPGVRDLYRRHARGNSLFRNRGDGTFEDVTLAARAQMGRWAWSSDAIDFDNDGWEDLYVVNGMFTRDVRADDVDLDGFFWRQVVARSPLTRVTGTPYDDAWRAINRLLGDRSQASHQRNVFLRNDGHGGFDDVSGTVGLDLDQDGRSFAVFDYDGDGDPDLVVMAARSSPQLRIFRNDYPRQNASLAIRLVGTKSNRDAVGARVTVETETLRRTKVVQAGSGFISQHSKELLFGLGPSRTIRNVRVEWPSGLTQNLSGVGVNQRVRVEEGKDARAEPFRAPPLPAPAATAPAATAPAGTRWFYEPFPAPDVTAQGRSLSALRGRPALLLFWSSEAAASRAALDAVTREAGALAGAGVGFLPVALESGNGSDEIGMAYTILNHYLFVGKEDLRLPTAFLLNGDGEIVKAYRDEVSVAQVLADVPKIDASPAERLARAVPFPGTFYSAPGQRNYLQYGLELVEQGLEAAALPAFERAAKGDPSAFALYSLGTLYAKGGQPAKARAAFERALQVKPDFAEASNGLGAVLAQGGDVPAAIARFAAALETTPDYPDALNNLGYAYVQTGRGPEAEGLFQKALALQPDFPEAFNNLGIFHARSGDMAGAESYFRQAVDKRPGYGEAANNLALVLMARDQPDAATSTLQRLLQVNPDFEMAYVTLAKIYLSTGRNREGMQVLERLLQKNPQHPLGLQMLREMRGGQ